MCANHVKRQRLPDGSGQRVAHQLRRCKRMLKCDLLPCETAVAHRMVMLRSLVEAERTSYNVIEIRYKLHLVRRWCVGPFGDLDECPRVSCAK